MHNVEPDKSIYGYNEICCSKLTVFRSSKDIFESSVHKGSFKFTELSSSYPQDFCLVRPQEVVNWVVGIYRHQLTNTGDGDALFCNYHIDKLQNHKHLLGP